MSEDLLLAKLREWRCLNPECRKIHTGPPSDVVDWRWCECGSSSERTHVVFELPKREYERDVQKIVTAIEDFVSSDK